MIKVGPSPFRHYVIVTGVLCVCVSMINATENSGFLSSEPALDSILKPPISDEAFEATPLHRHPLNNLSSNIITYLEDHRRTNPCSLKTTVDFINKAGYPAESHEVRTDDGYILTVHRIPRAKQENPSALGTTKIPVLLQHGFLCTSSDWIMQPAEKALPYILAETGLYDVWLGNLRGNKYAQVHENLTSKDNEFWNFSHDESGKYDIKAIVTFILSQTSQPQLFYIGHSMGNNVIYDFLSEQPEFNSKFKLIVSLAPAAFLGNTKSPIRALAHLSLAHNVFLRTMGSHQLHLEALKTILQLIGPQNCIKETINLKTVCNFGISKFGIDVSVINNSWVPIIFTQYPDTSSTKTLTHLLQAMGSGRFSKFDYGHLLNYQKYKVADAPDYDLSRITAPVAIFGATDDTLVDSKDVKYLASKLPNLKAYQTVEAEKFNHAGFIYGAEAKSLVYEPVLQLMKTHN